MFGLAVVVVVVLAAESAAFASARPSAVGTTPPTTCCVAGSDGGGAASGNEVFAWVVSAQDGGVARPIGTSGCSLWERDTTNVLGSGPPGPNGVPMNLYVRTCDGVAQGIWVPVLGPEDLARLAFADVSALVVGPRVALSPATLAGGLVNFPTWLKVAPLAPVSATAGPLPSGLSATTTATATGIRWDPGDGSSVVACALWGDLPAAGTPADAVGPCSWTPRAPSAPRFTHASDERFHGSVSLVWAVSWAATDGTSGSLGLLTTTTPVAYRVRELQSIGVDR